MNIFATFKINVPEVIDLGQTAIGHRRMVPITGGTVTGEIGEGTVLSGADWQWIQADGTITLDAHYVLRLSTGEFIEVESRGTRFTNKNGEIIFRTSIRMNTVSSRPDINQAMFTAIGTRLEDLVILEIYRVD